MSERGLSFTSEPLPYQPQRRIYAASDHLRDANSTLVAKVVWRPGRPGPSPADYAEIARCCRRAAEVAVEVAEWAERKAGAPAVDVNHATESDLPPDNWSLARYAVLRTLEDMDADGTFSGDRATWDDIGCRILGALGIPVVRDGASP